MEKYLFVLGRNWKLALAEIDTYLRIDEFAGNIVDYSANVAVVRFEKEQSLSSLSLLMSRLGSVMKIGKMVGFVDAHTFYSAFPQRFPEDRATLYKSRKAIENTLTDAFLEIFPSIKDEKLFIANSVYPIAFQDRYYQILTQHYLQFANKFANKQLKELGARSAIYFRYPQQNIIHGTLNPIFPHIFNVYRLYKPNRAEILHCLTEEGMYFGHTLLVTDPQFHKTMDEERPFKDFKQSVPPKFAKTLISFLALESPLEDKKILDPFCGSGTILQFAYVQGIDVYGIDIDPEKIEGARENLIFTAKLIESTIEESYLLSHIRVGKVQELDKYFERETFDGIVTEPVLLPFYRKSPEEQAVKKLLQEEVMPIYDELLKQACYLLKPGKRLCFISPLVITQRKTHLSLPILKMAEKYDLKPIRLLNPARLPPRKERKLRIRSSEKYHILDTRSERVSREFYIFERK